MVWARSGDVGSYSMSGVGSYSMCGVGSYV